MSLSGDLYHARNSVITKYGTLLHSACASGSKEMVETMINKLQLDHTINAQNNFGNTALCVVCEWGWLEIVQYLLHIKECKLNVLNCHGYSPFTLAINTTDKISLSVYSLYTL